MYEWENQFLLHLSEKVVLQEVFLRRMANLRLIFHWMTVRKKILGYCGAKSGRDVDKAKEIGLTYEEPETISVPGVKRTSTDTGMQSSL